MINLREWTNNVGKIFEVETRHRSCNQGARQFKTSGVQNCEQSQNRTEGDASP